MTQAIFKPRFRRKVLNVGGKQQGIVTVTMPCCLPPTSATGLLFFLSLARSSALVFRWLVVADILADLLIDSRGHIRVLAQILFGILAALAQTNIAHGEPCAALLDNAHLQTQVDQATLAGDALIEHDVEFSHLERR